MLEGLGTLLAAISFAGSVLVIFFLVGQLYLIGLHLALRRAGLMDEMKRLSRPLPADAELPHVVVQIPVFNEGSIIERAVSSAAKLDWPKDKLHIQICDDSDDETTRLAKVTMQPFIQMGIDIVLLRRADRSDFKAGNLRASMAKSDHDYFAIFDTDYVPPINFLRKCMSVLLFDQTLAFVQARPDFLNPEENAITKAQALSLDAHYAIEQATRSWAGQPLPFNGSAAIWRRAAIEAGGGWKGETLAEDMDLSYHAWLKGWRGIFITSVAVPSELPANTKDWATQQMRWLTGSAQVARVMFPIIWRDPQIPRRVRWETLLHLALNWAGPTFTFTYLAGLTSFFFRPELISTLGPLLIAILFLAVTVLFIDLRVGNRFVRGNTVPITSFIRDFISVPEFELYKLFAGFRSLWNTLSGQRNIFVRTVKKGSNK